MRISKSNTFILCIICIICILFSGCSNKEYLKGIDDAESGSAAEQYAEDRFTDVNGRYASSESGLYVRLTNMPRKCFNIYYYDYNKNLRTIWCNKLQCAHDSEECSSYISGDSKYDSIYFYDGKLYKFKEDDAGVYLESFNADGSGQKKLANMVPSDEKILQLKPQKFYGEYFYYVILNEQNNLIVYRIGLSDDAVADRLFEMEPESDEGISVANFYVNDKNIYASASARLENGEHKTIRYLYDLTERKRSIIYKDQSGKIVCNDKMYIMKSAGILTEFDSSGNEKNIEIKSLPGGPDKYQIYCNEKYIVFDNYLEVVHENVGRKIYIYEISTNILKECSLSAVEKKVKEEKGTVVVIGTDADSYNIMTAAFPAGIDGSGYYINYPFRSNIIRIRLDSSLWDELGEYSIIEMNDLR